MEIFLTLLFIALALGWAFATILMFVIGISQLVEWDWATGIWSCVFGVFCLIITIALVMCIFTVSI